VERGRAFFSSWRFSPVRARLHNRDDNPQNKRRVVFLTLSIFSRARHDDAHAEMIGKRARARALHYRVVRPDEIRNLLRYTAVAVAPQYIHTFGIYTIYLIANPTAPRRSRRRLRLTFRERIGHDIPAHVAVSRSPRLSRGRRFSKSPTPVRRLDYFATVPPKK